MATIVNDEKVQNTGLESFKKRKKDLINHVAFDDLYGYNGVITNLRAITSTLFTKIVDWAQAQARMAHDAGPFPMTEFRDPGDGTSYGAWSYEIQVDTKDNEDYTGLPEKMNVKASVIELLDPFNGLYRRDNDGHSKAYERLRHYCALGLYPVVTEPPSEDAVYDSVEKYDHFRPGIDNQIGMIVDVYEDIILNTGNAEGHLYAVVVWDPLYTMTVKDYMYGHKSGTLGMHGMIPTPEKWVNNDIAFEGNFAIPNYEFTPDYSFIFRIQNSPRLQELINTAVVSGSIELDYTRFLIGKVADMTQALGAVHPVDDTTAIVTGIQDEPETQEEEAEEVPVINATDTDDYTQRMRRLFHSDPNPDEFQSPQGVSITETLLHGDYPELG